MPESAAANINFWEPLVSAVTEKLSVESSTVLRDHTTSVFAKVLTMTLIKIAQKETTVIIEHIAPV